TIVPPCRPPTRAVVFVVHSLFSCLVSFSLTHTLRAFFFFFFNDTATTEIYTLSLHDALPILHSCVISSPDDADFTSRNAYNTSPDRKSTRLNSSHVKISYAVFCLKKKKKEKKKMRVHRREIMYLRLHQQRSRGHFLMRLPLAP